MSRFPIRSPTSAIAPTTVKTIPRSHQGDTP
jgi:hypothetical protein